MIGGVMAFPRISPQGRTLTCPMCNAVLPNGNMGVHAHLHKHVRTGELLKSDELSLRLKILNRTLRGNKNTALGLTT